MGKQILMHRADDPASIKTLRRLMAALLPPEEEDIDEGGGGDEAAGLVAVSLLETLADHKGPSSPSPPSLSSLPLSLWPSPQPTRIRFPFRPPPLPFCLPSLCSGGRRNCPAT